MDDNQIFILPPYPEKVVKLVMIDDNKRFQHCNDCTNFSMYMRNGKLDYCLECCSKDID